MCPGVRPYTPSPWLGLCPGAEGRTLLGREEGAWGGRGSPQLLPGPVRCMTLKPPLNWCNPNKQDRFSERIRGFRCTQSLEDVDVCVQFPCRAWCFLSVSRGPRDKATWLLRTEFTFHAGSRLPNMQVVHSLQTRPEDGFEETLSAQTGTSGQQRRPVCCLFARKITFSNNIS